MGAGISSFICTDDVGSLKIYQSAVCINALHVPQIRERAWWPTVYLAGDGSTYCTEASAGFLIVSTSQLFHSCLNVLVLSDTPSCEVLPDMLLHNQPYLPFVNPDPLKCCWPTRRVVFAEEQHKPCRRNQGRGATEKPPQFCLSL